MGLTMRSKPTVRTGFVALGVVLFGVPARAQVNPDSVKLRNDCRLAEQVLTTGEPATHRQEALTVIGLCGRESVPALLSVWSSIGGARTDLELLVTSTRGFVSPALVDTLLSVLHQPARALTVRVASLLVLLTYVDPWVVPGFDDFLGDSAALDTRYFGHLDHSGPPAGHETIPASLRDQLRTSLRAISASDPDAGMRAAARVALRNPPLR